jgi:1-deoxy-D-xylulose-5-phosphate synthase
VPGMAIMAPRDEEELRCMLLSALAYDRGPIAIRFPRGAVAGVEPRAMRHALEIGKGELLKSGADALLVGVGSMVRIAEAAAQILARAGIDVAVVDAKFVKPLDTDLILSAARPDAPVFALEESAMAGGFGDAILELFAGRALPAVVTTIGIPDRFMPHGKRDELLEEIGLVPEAVAAAVLRGIESRSGAG